MQSPATPQGNVVVDPDGRGAHILPPGAAAAKVWYAMLALPLAMIAVSVVLAIGDGGTGRSLGMIPIAILTGAFCLVSALNRSRDQPSIRLENGVLTAREGFIFRRSEAVLASDIVSLRTTSAFDQHYGRSCYLVALLRSGEHRLLLKGIARPQDALAIEQAAGRLLQLSGRSP